MTSGESREGTLVEGAGADAVRTVPEGEEEGGVVRDDGVLKVDEEEKSPKAENPRNPTDGSCPRVANQG